MKHQFLQLFTLTMRLFIVELFFTEVQIYSLEKVINGPLCFLASRQVKMNSSSFCVFGIILTTISRTLVLHDTSAAENSSKVNYVAEL